MLIFLLNFSSETIRRHVTEIALQSAYVYDKLLHGAIKSSVNNTPLGI